MARKKKPSKVAPTLTPVEELQRVLQTGIAVSDLAQHLARVNTLVREGIDSGDIVVPNSDFFRRLQSEMNRVSNLTIQVRDGVISVRKPGVFTQLWGMLSGPFKRTNGIAELGQAKHLMREQQKVLGCPQSREVIYAGNGCSEAN